MSAVLTALQADPARRRRRVGAAGLGLLLVGLAANGIRSTAAHMRDGIDHAARELHEANYPDRGEMVPYTVRRGDTLYGIDYRFTMPNERFHRQVGVYADHHFTPNGDLIDEARFDANLGDLLLLASDVDQ